MVVVMTMTKPAQTPVAVEITVYKADDKYLAARSNEFGFANYALIPAVAELNPLGVAPTKSPR